MKAILVHGREEQYKEELLLSNDRVLKLARFLQRAAFYNQPERLNIYTGDFIPALYIYHKRLLYAR